MSSSAFSMAAMARWLTPFGACTCFTYSSEFDRLHRARVGADQRSAMPWMTAVRPRLPSASVYSDQPTRPSSVVTFRKENVRQPASQCRSSNLGDFHGSSPRHSCRGDTLRRLRRQATAGDAGDTLTGCRTGDHGWNFCNDPFPGHPLGAASGCRKLATLKSALRHIRTLSLDQAALPGLSRPLAENSCPRPRDPGKSDPDNASRTRSCRSVSSDPVDTRLRACALSHVSKARC